MSAELGHFAKVQGGFAFKSKDFGSEGIPVIKIANVTGGGFVDLSSYECIQPDFYPKIGQFLTERDDVLIAMTGANVGKVVRISHEQPQCAINQRVGRLQLKAHCDYSKDFFYYLTSSPTGYKHFVGAAYGSAQPNISAALIEKLQIPNISPAIANQASSFLRQIDDKIHLNHQINQTLEQMAQAIFKSWFVDFEPVKAKIAALEAGLPAPREGIFYTYALECGDGSLYIGQTDNLRRRWHEHRMGKGAQWTKARLPLRIAHFEECDSRECAVAKEKEWKTTAGRRNLKKLIANGATRQAGGSEEDALLAAMQAISGNGEAELTRLQAEQPEQYAELRATAELFPSAMQDSEFGEIPEGWEIPNFEDIVSAKQGKYLAKDKMCPLSSTESNVPVWGGNGILGYTAKYSYSSPVVLMTCRGSNCGLIRHTESESWVSNNAFACTPKIGSVWFLLTYFNASSFEDCISGSAQPQITYSALRSKRLAFPVKENACDRYSELTLVLFDQILQLREESSTLEILRDTLLPKLLTGELSVSEAKVLAVGGQEHANV
ncbi:restriction endonuclease subunit S [Desulfurispira natronophila]|uniref:Restriction endonuclease S subunit n=1 Tax=Desulfurispira natronophila TaxID=682562 RepID=A0A7W8DFY4_9BACT|nr:restriction endonuclease subunit S [Desulfurispira natronophila]MBB5020820.1 restriction endonuclease S subunit [Desulfurispira natronophila]